MTDPKKRYVISMGDTISLGTPGGGGYSDPKTRLETALATDVAAGYVTNVLSYRAQPIRGPHRRTPWITFYSKLEAVVRNASCSKFRRWINSIATLSIGDVSISD